MVGTIIFIACLIFDFVVYDFILRFHYLFFKKDIDAYFKKFQKERTRAVYRYAQIYAGFTIHDESEIRDSLPSSFVILCNHQSLADILVVLYSFPDHFLKFVAKKALKFGIPTISLGARIGKHSFINRRGDFKTTIKELKKLAGNIKEGECTVIFPEGTRSRTGEIGQFHTAAVRVMIEHTKLPIVSVALGGGTKIVKFIDLFKHLRGTQYRIKIMNVYPHPASRKKLKTVLEKVRTEISNQVEKWKKEKLI